jgi:hypothetical protein
MLGMLKLLFMSAPWGLALGSDDAFISFVLIISIHYFISFMYRLALQREKYK